MTIFSRNQWSMVVRCRSNDPSPSVRTGILLSAKFLQIYQLTLKLGLARRKIEDERTIRSHLAWNCRCSMGKGCPFGIHVLRFGHQCTRCIFAFPRFHEADLRIDHRQCYVGVGRLCYCHRSYWHVNSCRLFLDPSRCCHLRRCWRHAVDSFMRLVKSISFWV